MATVRCSLVAHDVERLPSVSVYSTHATLKEVKAHSPLSQEVEYFDRSRTGI